MDVVKMASESLRPLDALSKKRRRLQQVFGDKLKVEEKLQVLDALISVCEQKPDLIVNCHPGTNSNTNELHHKSQARGHYECDICKKRFESGSQYYGHLAAHRRDDFPWTCMQCPKGESVFKSLSHLRKHEKSSHSTAKEYKCKYCNDTFPQSASREAHQNRMHSEYARFSCQFCDKTFYKRSDLRTHLATHLSLQGSVCEVCGRSFSHISNLIRHSYLHTGVKPYPCNICGRRFTQLSSLKQHKISYHENLSIPCPALPHQCEKVFRTPVVARQHAYRVHPGILWEKSTSTNVKQKQNRNYYCRNCGETFQFAKDLKVHNLEHKKCESTSEKELMDSNNITDCDPKSLQSALESNPGKHYYDVVEDCIHKVERDPVEDSADDFFSTLQEINCSSFSFVNVDLCSNAPCDAVISQQIMQPGSVCSKPESDIHGKQGSTNSENQPSCLYLLQGEQKNQFSELQSLNMEEVELSHQITEVVCLQTEDHEKVVSPAQCHCVSVDENNTNSNDMTEYQCLKAEDDEDNNHQTEPVNADDICGHAVELATIQGLTHQLTEISSLNERNIKEQLVSQLGNLKYMNVQDIHQLDNDSQITEIHSMNMHNDEHINQLTELQCLNIQNNYQNVGTFIPSFHDGTGNEDTCSTLLKELEHQDQCLSVNEDTCSTLLKHLDCQDSSFQVTEDTCTNLLNEFGKEDESSIQNTNQISKSIIHSLSGSTEIEGACSTLIENEVDYQGQCLNIHSNNVDLKFGIPFFPAHSHSPTENCDSSILNETEEPEEHDTESAVAPGEYVLTMEFSDDIISLLPKTSEGPEEIVIYVSQEDGTPAEVRIKPIMTTMVASDSSHSSIPDDKDGLDELQLKKKKKPNRTKRKCPECDKIFFKTSNLRQHLGTHFPNMQGYECDICNQCFAWKSTLNKHKISTHAIVLRQYLCDLCGRQYNTITQVKEHKRRDHQSLRPNTCNICNKSFFRKYDLHIHQRIHTNAKPFMCGTCGKTFNHLSHVKRHESVHQSV